LNDKYSLEKIYPIKLGRGYENTFLLIYKEKDDYETLIKIVKFDYMTHTWQVIYFTKKFGKYVKFLNRRWNLTDTYVLVLYENTGSGSYLTYEVLDWNGSRVIKHVEEDFIIFGSIFFKEHKLIKVTCNQYWVWEENNKKFVLKPYRVSKMPDAEIIEYSLVGKGADESTYKVITDKLNYKVPVGKKIQIIRKDFNDIAGNLRVGSNDDCMKFLELKNGFTITSKCRTIITVQITAGAYNWDSLKKIKIKTL